MVKERLFWAEKHWNWPSIVDDKLLAKIASDIDFQLFQFLH